MTRNSSDYTYLWRYSTSRPSVTTLTVGPQPPVPLRVCERCGEFAPDNCQPCPRCGQGGCDG